MCSCDLPERVRTRRAAHRSRDGTHDTNNGNTCAKRP